MKWLKKVLKNKKILSILVLALTAGAISGAVALSSASGCQPRVPGGECDSNAIVSGGVPKNQIASLVGSLDAKGKAAYSHAGIPGGCSYNNVVTGVVTRDNRVIVGGETVATNAYTYGRGYMSGSTQIPGGAYMRHPSVSFRSASITSWVCMEGKEFKWAVISTCGNPVTATPTHKNNPRISLTKTVSKQIVKKGETFYYTVTTKNIGNVALHNVVTKDLLPDGVVMASGAKGNPRIAKYGTLQPGQQKVWKLVVKTTDSVALNKRLRNLACVTTHVNPNLPICDDAYVIVKAKPGFKIVKTSDVSEVGLGDEFNYTLKVTNTGDVNLKGVDIGDRLPQGIKPVLPNDNIVYNESENKVNFRPKFQLNVGQSATRTLKVKVVGEPKDDEYVNIGCVVTDTTGNVITCDDNHIKFKKPKFACNALNAATVDADEELPFVVSFSVDASASNGAVIQSYLWNFGDGVTDETSSNSTQHSFTKTGEFLVTARVKTNKGTTPVSDKCSIKIKVTEKPKQPVYTCDALHVTKVDNTKFRFAVDYTAKNGATLKSYTYDFGDGNSVTTASNPVDHTYSEAGSYNSSVKITFMVNGEEKTVSSDNCKKTINIVIPQEPVYTCDLLNVEHLGELSYKFTVDATAANGASVKSYSIAYGDDNSDPAQSSNVFEHTYAEPGTYNVQATVVFDVKGEEKTVTSESCAAVINTEKPENCTVPGKEHLPADSPECKPDTPETPETPVTPSTPETPVSTVLPDTGAGDILGVFAAVSLAGMVAYRFVWLRQYQ